MTLLLERSEIERFRALVSQRLGLQFEDGKLDFLGDVLRRRIVESGCGRFAAYLERLASPGGAHELQPVAEELTVPETHFFRNRDQLRAFAHGALPECVRVQSARRRLRILSAGCASGEEPYTLAILLREELPALVRDWHTWRLTIRAVDVNAALIRRAARGRYSAWSMRGTPDDLRERYFRGQGREFELEESVRGMVSFEVQNLVGDDDEWERDVFDVVFCRNVLMYFSPEMIQVVVGRLARSLRPGGFLFLGHAETLRGISQDFHLRHTHDAFYYQRRGAADSEPVPETPGHPMAAAPGYVGIGTEPGDSWMKAIGRASRRIEGLATGPRNGSAPAASGATVLAIPAAPPAGNAGLWNAGTEPPATPDRSWDLGLALELLRQERFAEAMDVLHTLPPASGSDPDTQLLRAVLLTNGGALEEAEEVCRRLLASDELNSGARYLMALCREHAGDRGAAAEHDRAAIYLDPGFAMPHLHLGLLAKRAGDLATARHELGEASGLLTREDASRILLLGGGFSREALVRLCARELLSCAAAS